VDDDQESLSRKYIGEISFISVAVNNIIDAKSLSTRKISIEQVAQFFRHEVKFSNIRARYL
jgi:hypothetical protein